jgi:ribosome biogenesis GTPase / thiamine phosphate phosphatase
MVSVRRVYGFLRAPWATRMEDVIVYDIYALGFGPFFEEQIQSLETCRVILARISAEHRGSYEVWSEAGDGPARLAGRLRIELGKADLPGVGDWVLLREPLEVDRTAIIDRVLVRRTVFTRGAAGREGRVQVIAANVDIVFAVCGLDEDFNIHRIERYLTRIWASGAHPSVILNKSDVCKDVKSRWEEVERACPRVPIYLTSALQREGLDPVRACVDRGVTVALVGSSGAGKSTLVNALLGEERMPTGATRARDGRGRHITTHRQLVSLPGGGLLLDTPGMRELALVDEQGLQSVFDDVATLSARCRYRDCRHQGEPGCAVRQAVETGSLSEDRLSHYQQLEQEAEAYEQRHDARLRRQTARVWGQLHEEVAQLRHWKGGKG